MQTLRLTRRGAFTVDPRATERATQCGRHGANVFRYHVVIECPPEALDSDGFIIDNAKVQRYFVEKWRLAKVIPSCEVMAMKAVAFFAKRVPLARRIEATVRLAGRPEPDDLGSYAGLTATWERDNG